jgi:hypothetical protein
VCIDVIDFADRALEIVTFHRNTNIHAITTIQTHTLIVALCGIMLHIRFDLRFENVFGHSAVDVRRRNIHLLIPRNNCARRICEESDRYLKGVVSLLILFAYIRRSWWTLAYISTTA